MDFVSKVNDILMLDDEKSYFVKSQVEVNGENYLLLQEVPNKFNDMIPENSRNIEFVKEVVDEDNEFYLETVESVELKQQILKAVKK